MALLPPEAWVFLIAMSPFVESRGAVPVGVALGLPVESAAAISFAGNLVPVLPLLLLLERLERIARRLGFLSRLIDRLFAWTRERHGARTVGRAGLIATAILPAPFTGAWTGCLVAYLFNLRMRFSLPVIVIGVVQEVVVVTLIVLGGAGLLQYFTG